MPSRSGLIRGDAVAPSPAPRGRGGVDVKNIYYVIQRKPDKITGITVLHGAVIIEDPRISSGERGPNTMGIMLYEDGYVDNSLTQSKFTELIIKSRRGLTPEEQDMFKEIEDTRNISKSTQNTIINIFQKLGLNMCAQITEEDNETDITGKVVLQGETDLNIDINSIFPELHIQENQIFEKAFKWYFLYVQTYILDIMHDFNEYPNIYNYFIRVYRANIIAILEFNSDRAEHEIINKNLKFFIANRIFGIDQKDYRFNLYNTKQI